MKDSDEQYGNDPLANVLLLKNKHQDLWRDRDDAFWFARFMQEVGELAGALVGNHEHPSELEMYQCAAILLNWLEKRRGEPKTGSLGSYVGRCPSCLEIVSAISCDHHDTREVGLEVAEWRKDGRLIEWVGGKTVQIGHCVCRPA